MAECIGPTGIKENLAQRSGAVGLGSTLLDDVSSGKDQHDTFCEFQHTKDSAPNMVLTDQLGFSPCGRRNLLGRFRTSICKNFEPFPFQSYLYGSALMGLSYR